jgi:sulfotransferase
LYNYLEVEHYKHDFNNIKQITKEDDSVYGIYGDHNIRTQIEILPDDYNYILGKDVSDWIANNYNWLIERFGY